MSDQDNNIFSSENNENQNTTENNSNEGGTPNPEPTPSSSPQDQLGDLLAGITDESGRQKYKSVDQALEALAHSQNHIQTLEQENRQNKERLEQLQAEKERIDNLERTIEELTTRTSKDNQSQETPQSDSLNEDVVADLVSREIQKRETVATAKKNVEQVQASLNEKFGDRAAEIVREKAKKLGTTTEKIGELASENPQLVLSLFEENSGGGPANTTGSSVNIPPRNNHEDDVLRSPEKSILVGATSKEQEDFMKKVKEHTYKRLGVET